MTQAMKLRSGYIENQDDYIIAQRRRIQILDKDLLNLKKANPVKDHTTAKLEYQLKATTTTIEANSDKADFYKKQANKKKKPVILAED